MNQKELDILKKAQQGELDAVPMYQKLSKLVKDEKYKKIFLEVARDEGKHASILKDYTQDTSLRPKYTKTKIIAFAYKLIGPKKLMKIISKGELDAVPKYEKLVKKYPKIKEVVADEARHAQIALDFAKTL